MTPNTFEGGSLKGDLGPVSYYAGVLTAMKKRNADEFINIAKRGRAKHQRELLHVSRRAGVLAHRGAEGQNLALCRARSAGVFLLATPSGPTACTEDTKLRLSGPVHVPVGHRRRASRPRPGLRVDAWIGGIKGDFIYSGLTLTAGYTLNGVSGRDNWQAPYGSWPGYTSMIVEDFNRAEEQALLVGASFDFAELAPRASSSRHWPPSISMWRIEDLQE